MRAVLRSQSKPLKLAKQAVLRLWPHGDKMVELAESMQKVSFCNLRALDQQKLVDWAKEKVSQSKVYFTNREKVKQRYSADALDVFDERMLAFSRIPVKEIMAIDKLPEKESLSIMADLLDKHSNSGNRCGHNPEQFAADGLSSPHNTGSKIDPLTGGKRRPQIVYEVYERFMTAILHPSEYKHLFFQWTKEEVKCHGKNWRKIRTEGRESMLLVMRSLLLAWNPRSMQVGHYVNGKISSGISVKQLMSFTGLSEDRTKTGLRLLEQQHILHKTKQRREHDGKNKNKWRGFAVIRVFKPTMFAHLGLGDRMPKEREDPAIRLTRKNASGVAGSGVAATEEYLEQQRTATKDKTQCPEDLFASMNALFD